MRVSLSVPVRVTILKSKSGYYEVPRIYNIISVFMLEFVREPSSSSTPSAIEEVVS
jgi:hypothetical protein